jgi:CubicO group peptidase (beta-lactamase class C family)
VKALPPPRRWLAGLGALLALVAAAALIYRNELTQLWRVAHLFDADAIVYNFQHMDELFPSRTVRRGDRVFEFGRGACTLPASFRYAGRSYDTEAFLEATATTGLLIVRDDTILLERYALGHSAAGRHIAWSVSKSVVSALFGIAVAEGYIRDIAQPVTDYVPELVGSGYDGVSIKDVLQMSSGVRFDEDYGDPRSDINRMGRALAMGSTLLEFATTLTREREPGTRLHYVSIDTQVLGTILVRATGRSLAEFTSEKLWQPLGMESDAYWMLDGSGMEMAFGGLNATLRDYARFGRLYLDRGRWEGRQIVPEEWVVASIRPDAPHLMPGPKPGTSNEMGYGYQWWLPAAGDGEFMALGVYNQMIYVDPKHRLVIVKNSANRDFQRNGFEPTRETLALWRAVAADLEGGPTGDAPAP